MQETLDPPIENGNSLPRLGIVVGCIMPPEGWRRILRVFFCLVFWKKISFVKYVTQRLLHRKSVLKEKTDWSNFVVAILLKGQVSRKLFADWYLQKKKLTRPSLFQVSSTRSSVLNFLLTSRGQQTWILVTVRSLYQNHPAPSAFQHKLILPEQKSKNMCLKTKNCTTTISLGEGHLKKISHSHMLATRGWRHDDREPPWKFVSGQLATIRVVVTNGTPRLM